MKSNLSRDSCVTRIGTLVLGLLIAGLLTAGLSSGQGNAAGQPQAASPRAPSPRTAKFLSLHFGRVETEWMVEAAKQVDMMLFSANIQVTVPPAVRAANPKALCLGYLNTLDLGPRASLESMVKEWAEIDRKHEDWFLHDEKGQRILVYMHTGARDRYGLDRTNPGLQRYLAEKAKEIVVAGYDGVFLDNHTLELLFRRKDKYSGFPAGMTNARWQEGGRALLAAIKQAVGKDNPPAATGAARAGLVVYNGLHGGASRQRSSFQTEGLSPFEAAMQAAEVCDGGMWEDYFGSSGLTETTLRNAVDTLAAYNKRNKVTVALSTGESAREARTRFCLYLLSLDGDHAYFSYVPDYKRVRWYPVFDTDIGKPAADYELRDGVATRRFEKGFVAVNATERSRLVGMPQPYQNRYAEKLDELTLPPKSGEILSDLSLKIIPPETVERSVEASGGPVNLMGQQRGDRVEGGMVVTIPADIPLKAIRSASLVFTINDWDQRDEGEIQLNGHRVDLPISKASNGRDHEFPPHPVPVEWLRPAA
ncbi:MAG: hypothetical protein FJ279_22840, partial [Planctomycetes bacterium]|nr:hypothetical protein [Planctomycetota bacterium]